MVKSRSTDLILCRSTHRQAQSNELAQLVHQHGEVKKELARTRAAVTRSKGDVKALTERATFLAQQVEELTQKNAELEAQTAEAKEEASAMEKRMQEAQRHEGEVLKECKALRQETEEAQQQVGFVWLLLVICDGVSCVLCQLCELCVCVM